MSGWGIRISRAFVQMLVDGIPLVGIDANALIGALVHGDDGAEDALLMWFSMGCVEDEDDALAEYHGYRHDLSDYCEFIEHLTECGYKSEKLLQATVGILQKWLWWVRCLEQYHSILYDSVRICVKIVLKHETGVFQLEKAVDVLLNWFFFAGHGHEAWP